MKISPEKKPIRHYQLSKSDEGFYLIAEISPRHQVSRLGESIRAVMRVTQVPQTTYELETDFTDFPTQQQYQIRNGFWTVDGYHPKDIEYYTCSRNLWKHESRYPNSIIQGRSGIW